MLLTDAAIRRAKRADKPQKLSDGAGLYLLLTPTGARYWRWKYRWVGKEKLLALGVYPEVTLAAARAKRDEARRVLGNGVDPADHRRAAKAANVEAAANSFEAVAIEWLSKRGWVESYAVKVTAWLTNDVYPWIGHRPISLLEATDFLEVAQRVERRGAVETAHRILQNCGQIMRYAIATNRAKRNPVADLKGALAPATEQHYAAITDPTELGGLMRALEGYRGTMMTRSALALAPLVFVRPGELRHAEWAEFDFDLARWNIPAEKMKMRTGHIVPLSRQAVAILREIQALTGRRQYVFPGARDPRRPMSENTVNGALRRLGYEIGTMTGHGFRAAARTILDEVLEVRVDIIEHQLAHTVKDPNGRAYNRTAHLPQRAEMMQKWADYLDGLKAATRLT